MVSFLRTDFWETVAPVALMLLVPWEVDIEEAAVALLRLTGNSDWYPPRLSAAYLIVPSVLLAK
jgi:hypothetical protein